MEFKARKIKEESKVLKKLKTHTQKALTKTKDAVTKTRDITKIALLKTKKAIQSNSDPAVQEDSRASAGEASVWKKLKAVFRYSVALVGIVVITYGAFYLYNFASALKFDFSIPNIINTVFGEDLKTDHFGKTNILLLGVGGGLHDGGDLTDSILVASLDQNKKTVSLISLPRDLYVKITPSYSDRINTVYDYFKRRSGHEEAVQSVEALMKKITGLDIQYYAKVNFQGFREVVDILGGVDIDVPETLVDPLYPLEDKNGVFIRNEVFKVEKGLQHMDGDTALKYVRSRHSTSDFDRARRQQLVISALKAKALKENYLTNPNQLKRIYYAISSNLETDITVGEAIRAASVAKDIESNHIISIGLSDDSTRTGGFLYTPDRSLIPNGASVLLPNGATVGSIDYYNEIRRLVDIAVSTPEAFIEKPVIKISNATKVTGLGNQLKNKLARFGFTVSEVANLKTTQKITDSKIYMKGDNTFSTTLEVLQTFVKGEVLLRRPADVVNVAANSNKNAPTLEAPLPDIEIVIGQDYSTYLP